MKKNIYLLLIITSYLYSCSRFRNGYTDKISYSSGDTSIVYLSYTIKSYYKKICLYNIKGEIVDKVHTKVISQESSPIEPWANGFKYKSTFIYEIPNIPPGIYLWNKKVPFIIKSRTPKEITVVYPSNTENAYTNNGGKSLYDYNSTDGKAATRVSFSRTIGLASFCEAFLRWIVTEKEFDINYICDQDLDDYSIINKSKLIIIIGHSEYWTRKARENFDQFVDKGGDALILSGNTMWWQVRYDTINNQLICYRDLNKDPIQDSLLKTINWYESPLKYPIEKSIGVHFKNASFGHMRNHPLKIINEKSPLLDGTNLKNGDTLSLPTHEFDGPPVEGFTSDSIPIINNKMLGFYKIEPIGFTWGDYYNQKKIVTWIVFQKTPISGKVINVASTNWCSNTGIGGSNGKEIKIITKNMINKLLKKENIFSK